MGYDGFDWFRMGFDWVFDRIGLGSAGFAWLVGGAGGGVGGVGGVGGRVGWAPSAARDAPCKKARRDAAVAQSVDGVAARRPSLLLVPRALPVAPLFLSRFVVVFFCFVENLRRCPSPSHRLRALPVDVPPIALVFFRVRLCVCVCVCVRVCV